MSSQHTIIVTGGAGFIGSHLVRELVNNYPDYKIVNLDALTYAGNLENLKDIDQSDNYVFEKADIRDAAQVDQLFKKHQPDGVIHLAAESHVDRSIENPSAFVETNVMGTVHLLNAFRSLWQGQWEGKRFYHISTDEVYGTLGETGLFTETTPYDPNSPYSASKAASDHLVRAYGETYDMPYVITNCSNNYGPNQFPEKLIPLFINNIIEKKPLPVYGDGNYTRDWLFVIDHAKAIDLVYHKGVNGETYNIGGFNEWKNIDLVKVLCQQMDQALGRSAGESAALITFVKDRPGHDWRYAIDSSKIEQELAWRPEESFESGLDQTIRWYRDHDDWVESVRTGAYRDWVRSHYG